MNSLLHRDRDEDIEDSASYGAPFAKDREITLGTTMILGIFFALAVFAAVFFGFGYSMGAKHAAGTATVAAEGSAPGTFSAFKPAPGSPLGSPARQASVTDAGPAVTPPPHPGAKPAPQPAEEAAAEDAPTPAVPAVKPIPRSALAVTPAPVAAVPVVAAASAAGSGAIVQVAAVSHQEDADLLVTTLKRRGYAVATHTEPQDHLLHVQIGPFANRADALAMRQKLLADGFNAIVK